VLNGINLRFPRLGKNNGDLSKVWKNKSSLSLALKTMAQQA
jgi:hypothetical protein